MANPLIEGELCSCHMVSRNRTKELCDVMQSRQYSPQKHQTPANPLEVCVGGESFWIIIIIIIIIPSSVATSPRSFEWAPQSRIPSLRERQLCEIAVSECGSAQLTGWLDTTYEIWSPELCLRPHFTHKTECPWPLHFKHSHWWKRQSRSKFTSYYAWGTNGVCECKMDGKVHMDSYMASNGSCFMLTWTIFKNHFLEAGLAQTREIMALRMLTSVCVFYFYHVWGPCINRNPLK